MYRKEEERQKAHTLLQIKSVPKDSDRYPLTMARPGFDIDIACLASYRR